MVKVNYIVSWKRGWETQMWYNIPKLYKMLTKFSNISQFNLQAWVVQEVDDEFYLSDKSSG